VTSAKMIRAKASAMLAEQLMYEKQGAEAAHHGKLRKDCPYDRDSQKMQWNHWVYGLENEATIIQRGET